MAYPHTGTRFESDQLLLVVTAMMNGCMDRIGSALPQYDSKADQKAWRQLYKSGRFEAMVSACLETTGMSMACLYASITDDGLGIGDAIDMSGLDEVIDNWLAPYRAAGTIGKAIIFKGEHPDIDDCAKKFIEIFTNPSLVNLIAL